MKTTFIALLATTTGCCSSVSRSTYETATPFECRLPALNEMRVAAQPEFATLEAMAAAEKAERAVLEAKIDHFSSSCAETSVEPSGKHAPPQILLPL